MLYRKKYLMEKAANKTLFSRYRIIILVFIVVIIAWLCSHFIFSANRIQRVILISIDTCRADYLSCYGYRRDTTPNIDELAKEGILFENVISPVPMTLPAHSSMLTGTVPVYHGVHDNLYYELGKSNVTIAEILKDKGFSTGSVISAFVLDSRFGLDQGFDTYNDTFEEQYMAGTISERKGRETSRFAIKWLQENKNEKFFLFLHYFDPHAGYTPPEPFASQFANNLYAGEVAYTDHCIGQVIDKLKQLGLYDSTLIIITGDHGEMLGEHGEPYHAFFIYESAIKVPLIFKLPGQHKARRIKDIVGLIDIVPTVCSVLGIEPPKQVQGVSLSGFFEGQKAGYGSRYLYCESLTPTKYNANSLLGAVTSRYKYIQTTRPELYDLIEDPEENNNIIDQNRQLARVLQEELREILELSAGRKISDSRIELDAAAVERLKSLGYAGGSVQDDFEFDQTKNDPKDLIAFHNSILAVEKLVTRKKYAQAKTLCNKLLSQNPNAVEIHLRLADIASKLDDTDEMITQFTEILRLEPDHLYTHNKLATLLLGLGRTDEAITHFKEVLRLNPEHSTALANLGLILSKQEKFTEAAANFTRAMAINPQMPQIHYSLGKVLLQQGKKDEAIAQFKEELAINPEHLQSHIDLGEVLLDQGWIDEGIEHFEKALELESDKLNLLNRIGAQLALKGKFEPAVKYFKRALSQDERMVEARHNLAQVLLKQGKTAPAVTHFEKLLQINPELFSVHNDLAKISYQQGNLEKTIAHLSESVRIKPDQPVELDHLARALSEQGKIAEAIDYWNRALEFWPDWSSVLNNLAWAKANGENELLYDPEEAVRLARRACELTDFKEPALLDTLAAAFSAIGNFPEAVETAEKALELAHEANKENLAEEIGKHLELYKSGRSYREIQTNP